MHFTDFSLIFTSESGYLIQQKCSDADHKLGTDHTAVSKVPVHTKLGSGRGKRVNNETIACQAVKNAMGKNKASKGVWHLSEPRG